eukprot:2788488-Amphidinium_carterae.1
MSLGCSNSHACSVLCRQHEPGNHLPAQNTGSVQCHMNGKQELPGQPAKEGVNHATCEEQEGTQQSNKIPKWKLLLARWKVLLNLDSSPNF